MGKNKSGANATNNDSETIDGDKVQIIIQELRKSIREEVQTVFREEVRTIIKEELQNELADIRTKLTDLLDLKTTVDDLEKGAAFTAKRIDDIYAVSIPTITNYMHSIATQLAMQTLDIDMHRRKWNVLIQGINGVEDENEDVTRTKCASFARDTLELADASPSDFAACHRLKREKDAGIIVRFVDLNKRDKWLRSAKKLKGHEDKISISADIPPVLRPLRKELLLRRKRLDPESKKKAGVRYKSSWPYMELAIKDKQPIPHEVPKESVVRNILAMDPHITIIEPTE